MNPFTSSTNEILSIDAFDKFDTGVLFVRFENKSLVLKRCKYDLAEQVFGNCLASFFGLCCPQMFVLFHSDDSRFSVDMWIQKLHEWSVTNDKQEIIVKLETEFQNMKSILMMESIPDLSILQKFHPNNGDQQVWKDFGKLLFVDILLNNSDRVPCSLFWDNKGNETNILFRQTSNCSLVMNQVVVALDQTLTPILVNDNRQSYLEKCATFFTHLLSGNERSYLLDLASIISKYSGYQVSEENFKSIHKGILESFLKLVENSEQLCANILRFGMKHCFPEQLSFIGSEVRDPEFFVEIVGTAVTTFHQSMHSL